MVPQAYVNLAGELEPGGIRCQFQTADQLVISRQVGPIWPDRGNSFWVTHVDGEWYLFTWAPHGYRVPETADIADLCRACMDSCDRAMGAVPTDILEQFRLVPLTDREVEIVYGCMGAA